MEKSKTQTKESSSLPMVQIAEKLNNSVASVLGNGALIGFEKAYAVANAINELKSLLSPEYMKPIMELQGNKLGFKTDKDRDGGYSETVVKNCLIEAVLFGLQPCGNQFNIIAGNMYATKEGVGYLLSKIEGLSYDIIAELPRIKDVSGAVVMKITWTLQGVTQTKQLDLPIKINSGMGVDAVIGKATRKARKWLYDTITGSEVPEGDVIDVDGVVVRTRVSSALASKESGEKIIIEDRELKVVSETPELFAEEKK